MRIPRPLIVLKTTTLAILAACGPPPEHLDDASEEYRGDNGQIVAPATGMPAGTVPMGYTYGNLPAGLQILARPYDEGVIFKLAFAYERGTNHRRPPERYPSLIEGPGER